MMQDNIDSSLIGPAQASLFRHGDQIKQDVEELIAENNAIDSRNIMVIVEEGVVTLEGSVKDLTMAMEASEAAREVLGVVEVRNHLEIVE